MGKYGKPNEVNLDPLLYNIGLGGESGVGKTTLIKEVCERLAGEDGYMFFDTGYEQGSAAINGIVSEPIEDWDKFIDVTDDIIENKETDYPNLKVVVIDTYDELCRIAEKEVVYMYNRKNSDKKVDSVSAAFGGYQRGENKVVEIILDRLFELKRVGVSSIFIFHVKKKEVEDIMTEEQYSILTSNVSQKYFNAVKTKLHFLGLAYIDREIVKEKTGKKDFVTKKDIYRSKIAGESRVINFRDDSYSLDSKSRFSDIVDKIPLDADEFIKAMKDAIIAEHNKSGKSVKDTEKKQAAEAKAKKAEAAEYGENRKKNKADPERNEELIAIIKSGLMTVSKETQKRVKELMKEVGSKLDKDTAPTSILEEIVELIQSDEDAEE